MKERTWEADYKGHTLKVTSTNSILKRKSSLIFEIDGLAVAQTERSILDLFSTLITKENIDGKGSVIEARVAQKYRSFSEGCQIFVNGTQIGGDYIILYPDPMNTEKHFEMGFFKYFISVGIVKVGLPFAILLTFIIHPKSFSEAVPEFVFAMVSFGLIMSILAWRGLKSRVAALNSIKS